MRRRPIEYGRAQWRRPRYWNRAIPVDFENIVLKAMAEGRDERYATARELAEDLRRFLEGKPILARRPSLGARSSKWARRHKRSVAAAAGALAAGRGRAWWSAWWSSPPSGRKKTRPIEPPRRTTRPRRTTSRRRRSSARPARCSTASARASNQRLASECPGPKGCGRELLAEMLPYYREFAREAADDPALQADLALTFTKIGYLSDQLGSQAEAEQAYQEARAILERAGQAQPAQREHRRAWRCAATILGNAAEARRDGRGARQQLERALAIQQQLVDASPASTEYRADLATTESNLGLLSSQTGDKQQAAERFRAAIEIQESIRRTDPQDEANLNNLAASYNNLSSLFCRMPSRPSPGAGSNRPCRCSWLWCRSIPGSATIRAIWR